MRRIKVAMLGTGAAHAAGAYMTMEELTDYFEVLGVCEPNLERLEKVRTDSIYKNAKWLTEDELFSITDLDAIFVEDYETELTKTALKAAKHNIHIYMDKPGGESHKEFCELVDLQKSNGKVFYTGYMYRHNPSIVKAKQMVKDGLLGEITSVEAQMSIKYSATSFFSNFKGGITYFLGCHLADLVYSILDEPLEIIPFSAYTGMDRADALDYGFTVYKYEKGSSFIKSNVTEVNGFDRRQIVITGLKGTIEIRPVEMFDKDDPLYLTSEMRAHIQGNDGKISSEVFVSPKYKRYDDMLIDFSKCVCGEKQNDYSYEYEKKLHEIIMKSF